jgi:hypothetical protein
VAGRAEDMRGKVMSLASLGFARISQSSFGLPVRNAATYHPMVGARAQIQRGFDLEIESAMV